MSRRWWKLLDTALGPFLGLLAVLALFALSPAREFIFTGGNCKTVILQTVVVAVGSLGMTLIIVSGGIDLSVGSTVALSGVVGATLALQGYPASVVLAGSLLTGGLIGLINGWIIAGIRMVPFIVTLGMMGMARGAAKWVAGSQTVNPPDHPIHGLMAPEKPLQFFPLPDGVWITALLSLLVMAVLRHSVFGRRVFAIGSNEATARLCGIAVGWTKVLIYAIAGLLFGLAGLLQYSRLTQGDPTTAIGLELDVIAAVVIGGASLSGGTGSVLGSLIGALIMAILRNGCNQLGWPSYVQEILIGLVIVLAVALDRFRHRRP